MQEGPPPPAWFPTDEAVAAIPFELLQRLLDLRTDTAAQGLFLGHREFAELHGKRLRRMQHYLKRLPETVQSPKDEGSSSASVPETDTGSRLQAEDKQRSAKPFSIWHRIAALLLILFGVGYLILYRFHDAQPPSTPPVVLPPKPPPQPPVSPRASRLDPGLLYSPAKRDPIVRLTSWINENDFTCLPEACQKDFCTITLHAYMAEFSLDLRDKRIRNQVQPWELLSIVNNREIGWLKNGAAGMPVEIKPGLVIHGIRYHWISITGEVEASRIQWRQ